MKMRCEPKTFSLIFGKEGKDLCGQLKEALEDFLNNLDYEMPGMTTDLVKELGRILYDLKTAPTTGYTPRTTVTLYEVFELEKIVRAYADKVKSNQHRFLAAHLQSIYEKMKDVKWG